MTTEDISVLRPEEAYWHMTKTFNMAIGSKPDTELRVKLIQEEAQEFIDAINDKDIVEAIDALCDLLYVTYGAAAVFGVNINVETAAKTEASGEPPRWAALKTALEGFDESVSWAIQALRSKDLGRIHKELTDLAEGCWLCGARGVGIDLRPYFLEVHRTNMHKLNGPRREDGKQLKPKGWTPPRIKYMLEREQSGRNPVCHVTAPGIKDGHPYNKSDVQLHPEGGMYCTFCGGVFVEVGFNQVENELRGKQ